MPAGGGGVCVNHAVDVLIPTYARPAALAVTLTSLAAQSFSDFRVVISDQTEASDPLEAGDVQAVLCVLRAHGHPVELYKHLPRRGMPSSETSCWSSPQPPACCSSTTT